MRLASAGRAPLTVVIRSLIFHVSEGDEFGDLIRRKSVIEDRQFVQTAIPHIEIDMVFPSGVFA
jgi:hypothetical protein